MSNMEMTDAIAVVTVEEYTGIAPTSVEHVPDPVVENTWAVRARFQDGFGNSPYFLDFIVKGRPAHTFNVSGVPTYAPDEVEVYSEVEFATWPPTVRA